MNKQKKIQLIFACAWCQPETYPALEKGNRYTHGICRKHKQQIIRDYYQQLELAR